MHYLSELIKNPSLQDPAKNHMNIHRHFYRYSKGDFIGPAIKITITKSRITIRGSHEYEDLIQEIVVQTVEGDNVDIDGVLITGKDISDDLQNFGLNWDLKKSTGKTKNYKSKISDKIPVDSLLKVIEKFRNNSYLLLSFNVNPTCKVTTKKRIPQPSKKKVEEDDVNKRVKFCTGVINNTPENLKLIIDSALPDFRADLPNEFKNLILLNNYKIKEIILPKDVKNSMLLRILAIRKGKIFRTLQIDEDIIEKQYNIVV